MKQAIEVIHPLRVDRITRYVPSIEGEAKVAVDHPLGRDYAQAAFFGSSLGAVEDQWVGGCVGVSNPDIHEDALTGSVQLSFALSGRCRMVVPFMRVYHQASPQAYVFIQDETIVLPSNVLLQSYGTTVSAEVPFYVPMEKFSRVDQAGNPTNVYIYAGLACRLDSAMSQMSGHVSLRLNTKHEKVVLPGM